MAADPSKSSDSDISVITEPDSDEEFQIIRTQSEEEEFTDKLHRCFDFPNESEVCSDSMYTDMKKFERLLNKAKINMKAIENPLDKEKVENLIEVAEVLQAHIEKFRHHIEKYAHAEHGLSHEKYMQWKKVTDDGIRDKE